MELIVCSGCAGGDALAEALRETCGEVTVRRAGCLNLCAGPVGVAAQAPGRATYVFSGVTEAEAPDMAVFVAEWTRARKGWIADARPLGALRFRLVARIPAMA